MEDDIDFESDDESLPPWEEYNNLLAELRRNEPDTSISIYRDIFLFILAEKIDEFCSALRLASSLKRISIGNRFFVDDEMPLPTLEITPENYAALNKLGEAIRFIGNRLESLDVGLVGRISSAIVCPILVAASRPTLSLQLYVPWRRAMDGDMTMFGVMSFLEFKAIDVTFVGITNVLPERHVDDGNQPHHLQIDGPLWHLLRLRKMTNVNFEQIEFTFAECKCIEEILLSKLEWEDCQVSMDRCKFPRDGGKLISSAIGRSISLYVLSLHDVFGDDEFCQDLIQNIPLSPNLGILTIGFGTDDSIEGKEAFLTNLLKATMKQNSNELATIFLELPHASAHILNEERQVELLPFLQQNFDLRWIEINDAPIPVFETILRLNRAGRRYLIEDSASKESCIEVLSKVNEDLDSLFFHVRENPILFTGTCDDDKEQDVEYGFGCQIL